MSAMDVDKSLDEIIAGRPRGASRGRGARRGAAPGGAGGRPAPRQQQQPQAAGGARARYAGAIPGRANAAPAQGSASNALAQQKGAASEALKVIISNLPLDVEEESVRELMISTVGPCKTVELAYDSRGKSKGIATVIFVKKGSAQKAFEQYNNRMIDQR